MNFSKVAGGFPRIKQPVGDSVDNSDRLSMISGDGGGGRRLNQKAALQKLAKSFAKKKAEKKNDITSWQNLVKNALNLQRGKIPLLLAVEAGNQSMCRELLSAQTAEQLKVKINNLLIKFHCTINSLFF